MAAQESVERPIKLQIPVSRELADELARWAEEMEWTQGRLAAVLLEHGSADRSNIGKWLTKRVAQCTGPGIGPGWLQKGDNSAVRLQVSVNQRVAWRIEKLASALNQTTVRVAALLIDFALCDEKWVIRLVKSKFGKALRKLLGGKFEAYESAELPDENDHNT
jgi:hypothetical protein